MRRSLVAIVMIGLPIAAAAQSRATPPPAPTALPPIGLPLAPIGLPLPPLGLPAAGETRPAAAVPHRPGGGDHDGRGPIDRGPHVRPAIVYLVPDSSWAFPLRAPAPGMIVGEPAAAPAAPEAAVVPLTGTLRFEVDARGPVQAFVDGVFVGTLDEIGHQVELEEGTHRIELKAARYETLAVDVKIGASRAITYTARMTLLANATPAPRPPSPRETTPPREPRSPEPAAPAGRTTIYFIPGCYLGNVPPEQVALPDGCDRSQLVTRPPPQMP